MGCAAQAGLGWDPLGDINNWLWNAATGTQTPLQKEMLIYEEAKALIKASGGKMSWDEAWNIASGDVTRVLMAKKADPSQASPKNLAVVNDIRDALPDLGQVNSAIKWGLLGLGAVFLIVILKD